MKARSYKFKLFVLFFLSINIFFGFKSFGQEQESVIKENKNSLEFLQKESFKKESKVQKDGAKKMQNAHLAGSWYSSDKIALQKELAYYFDLAKNNFKNFSCINSTNGSANAVVNCQNSVSSENVVALIVPHAGYYFSGLCAASAYQAIVGQQAPDKFVKVGLDDKNKPERQFFDRAIIIGPSHTKFFSGIALPNFDEYKTPMGALAVDMQAVASLQKQSLLFKVDQEVWQKEHSVEIQLPYLQFCFGNLSHEKLGDKFNEGLDFAIGAKSSEKFSESVVAPKIVPLVVGQLQEKDLELVARAIGKLLSEDKKTLIIISSDFTHYGQRFGYTPAFADVQKFDAMAIRAVENKSCKEFDNVIKQTGATICGHEPIKILLKLMKLGFMGQVECRKTCYYNSSQMQKARSVWQQELVSEEKEPASVSRDASVDKAKQVKVASENRPEREPQLMQIDVSKLSKEIQDESFVAYAALVCKSLLTPKEQKILLTIAHNAIASRLFPEKKLSNNFQITENLHRVAGAFVTLKTKDGNLRGCIGRIFAYEPLYKTISDMALSAAFEDSRFAPLAKHELENIVIDITILTKLVPIKTYSEIIIGKHGVILEKIVNGIKKSAVYLPQVAVEQGWNLQQMLSSLSEKAGLDKDAYKNGCQFKVFEGFEFS